MAGGYSHVKTDAFMPTEKYVAATMKVPVRDHPGRCSHQPGFFHSPCASPAIWPESATISSIESTGSPPGHAPSGANANIAARFITSAGERCGTSDSREAYQATSVVSQAGVVVVWSAANSPRSCHSENSKNVAWR